MARKPNYDFERREREKAKAAKTADRVKAKTGKGNEPGGPDNPEAKAIPIEKLDASNDD